MEGGQGSVAFLRRERAGLLPGFDDRLETDVVFDVLRADSLLCLILVSVVFAWEFTSRHLAQLGRSACGRAVSWIAEVSPA